ncbi:hypothetical protein CBF34_03570 [Vagococcus penaei]|uniref:FtsX-like permease family protein n=1 Tax=Vagococcus penaei TaxID=633807 RepID=UPI000F88BA39|nr:ABC transporter permease [Vagococcus penaei]RSU05845.1 hypothetical protein CBF34_03570 [Vagococcus penaei]
MTLFKLAYQNVKSQKYSYFMYCFSMAFSVLVYYIFVGISNDYSLVKSIAADFRIDIGLQTATTLITIFVLIFIFNANSFFIEKRKNEIGLYSLLGMRKRQIAHVFFIENMIIGGISLGVGLVSGIFFSKLFSMILLKFMVVDGAGHIIYSSYSIIKTSLVFIGIFLIVSLRYASTIYRYPLMQLFYSDKGNSSSCKVGIKEYLFGLLSIVMFLLLMVGVMYFNVLMMIGRVYLNARVGFYFGISMIVLLGIGGMCLFYYNVIPILIYLFKKNKRWYYKDLNLVTVGQFTHQFSSHAKNLIVITFFLLVSLATVTLASLYFTYSVDLTDHAHDVDFAVSSDEYGKFSEILVKNGVTPKQTARMMLKPVTANFDVILEDIKMPKHMNFDIISQSEYNEARKMKPSLRKLKTHKKNDVYMFIQMNQTNIDLTISYSKKATIDEFGSVNLLGVYQDRLGNEDDIRQSKKLLLVSDQLYNSISKEQEYSYYWINISESKTAKKIVEAVNEVFDIESPEIKLLSNGFHHIGKSISEYDKILDFDQPVKSSEKTRMKVGMKQPYTTVLEQKRQFIIYATIFLALLFWLSTISMMMFKQFSMIEKQQERYSTLIKLGVSLSLIRKNIYKENAVIFFIPMGIAFFLMLFMLNWVYIIIPVVDMTLTRSLWGILIVLYFLFYVMTSHSAYRMVQDKVKIDHYQ